MTRHLVRMLAHTQDPWRLPRLARHLALGFGLCATLPNQAGAVACPDPGSRVAVCVRNPTGSTTPQITVSGVNIGNEVTCTGPPPISASYSKTFTLTPGETRCFEGSTALPDTPKGLWSGRYIHRISVPTTGQSQAQQGTVLFSSTGNWPRVDWTYFPNVLTVTDAGDSSCGSSCVSDCTLRQAINLANAYSTATSPVLIRFATTTPIQLTQSCPLSLTGGDITIDGTDNNGNPFIVGDRNAALAGNQDAFPRVIDLKGVGSFAITSPRNTLRGLHIKNSLSTGTAQSKHLIAISTAGATNNLIVNTKIEGGNTLSCPGQPGCSGLWDLVNAAQGNLAVVMDNVEAHSGIDQGAEATADGCFDVRASWFHHNYRGGIRATNGDSFVGVERSTVELSGRRATDNAVVANTADGLSGIGTGPSTIGLYNVIWMNRDNGLELDGEGTDGDHFGDYVCGNGGSGVGTFNLLSGCSDVVMYNSASVYNLEPGVRIQGCWSGPQDLAGGNAFARNDTAAACDFRNDSSTTMLPAFNFWGTGTPAVCGSAPTNPFPTVNPVTDDLTLDTFLPIVPTNALLKGQTIRLTGNGFNAIAGNPAISGADCQLGDSPTQSCCLVKPAAANVCGSGIHNPLLGGGNCVEIKDRLGTWEQLKVTAVTPGMIVTEVPRLFPCVGGDGEIWVGKRLTPTSIDFDFKIYCTN